MKDSKIDNDVTGRFVTQKKNIHPTVKPIKLMKYLCRLITPKGGTILDPFMGSGSTGMVAKEENFDFIGIEKEEEYFNIATARIESVETKSTLEDFMIKKISVVCLLPTFVFATNPCEYDNQTTSTMQGTVESVIVKDKTVTEYFRETKKCKVLIKAKILGKWYMTSQDYIFTPDMSENEACQNAVNRKGEIITKVCSRNIRIN